MMGQNPNQMMDPSQMMGQNPNQMMDPSQMMGQNPNQMMDPSQMMGQQNPYQMMGQNPSQMMGQNPYQMMGQNPNQMMGQNPNQMMNFTGGYQQNGGGGKTNYPYKKERNTPFNSNDSKQTYKRRKAETSTYEPPVLLEQKIYEPRAGKSKPGNMEIYPPAHVPVPNPYYPLMNPLYAYGYKPNRIPIQKVYNVSLSNPSGDHSTLSRVYEDMLPGKDYAYSFNTLGERLSISSFIRSSILTLGDGEEMNITGGKNSLLSYIKLLEMNPYNNGKHGDNPYSNLPDRMLIYRSAYPIRHESNHNNNISIAKESTGLNIRIYELNKIELNANTLSKTKLLYDVWREVHYYEYIKEQIIKKNVCPNFVSIILYKKDSESKINFAKLRTIKRKTNSVNVGAKAIADRKDITNNYAELQKEISDKLTFRGENNEDLSGPSNISLVMVTEAPTHNIINWCSKIYEGFGAVNRMVSTGYHADNVWYSVMFQLLVSMAVLQENRIHFHNFSLEDNIYIKDIYANTDVLGYYKYIIDGISYYIPNYGYILLVDSNFKDLEDQDVMKAIDQDSRQQHKLISTMFEKNHDIKNSKIDKDDITQMCYKDFKDAVNPNNFTLKNKRDGLVGPSETVHGKFSEIFADNDSTKVKDYILKYMKQFLHNRVGDYLNAGEIENIQNINRPTFNKGELIPYRIKYNTYIWAIYLEEDNSDTGIKNKVCILTKDNPSDKEASKKSVPFGNLKKYNNIELVKQDYDTNKQNLDESRLLETYVF
jgi:hypothetical protein